MTTLDSFLVALKVIALAIIGLCILPEALGLGILAGFYIGFKYLVNHTGWFENLKDIY